MGAVLFFNKKTSVLLLKSSLLLFISHLFAYTNVKHVLVFCSCITATCYAYLCLVSAIEIFSWILWNPGVYNCLYARQGITSLSNPSLSDLRSSPVEPSIPPPWSPLDTCSHIGGKICCCNNQNCSRRDHHVDHTCWELP